MSPASCAACHGCGCVEQAGAWLPWLRSSTLQAELPPPPALPIRPTQLTRLLPHCCYLAGIPIDGKTVFTSDHALKLEWLPNWIAIIGSGYIGLEFSDVYTALGCEVTFIEAMPNIMPGFDKEIARMAQRLLIQGRPIDYHTNVLATKVTPGVPGEQGGWRPCARLAGACRPHST